MKLKIFTSYSPMKILIRMIKHLNADQKRVFDEIVDLEQYIKELNSSTSNNVNNRLIPKSVLRKFVSGIGGTGKSYLITIQCHISNKLN